MKQGKLNRVPQTMVFMEGIWPPELVPLFMKDGAFPEYADEDKTSGTRDFSFARHSRTPPHSKVTVFCNIPKHEALRPKKGIED